MFAVISQRRSLFYSLALKFEKLYLWYHTLHHNISFLSFMQRNSSVR